MGGGLIQQTSQALTIIITVAAVACPVSSSPSISTAVVLKQGPHNNMMVTGWLLASTG